MKKRKIKTFILKSILYLILIMFPIILSSCTTNINAKGRSLTKDEMAKIYGFSFELPEDRCNEVIEDNAYIFTSYESCDNIILYMNNLFISLNNNDYIKTLAYVSYKDTWAISLKSSSNLDDYEENNFKINDLKNNYSIANDEYFVYYYNFYYSNKYLENQDELKKALSINLYYFPFDNIPNFIFEIYYKNLEHKFPAYYYVCWYIIEWGKANEKIFIYF